MLQCHWLDSQVDKEGEFQISQLNIMFISTQSKFVCKMDAKKSFRKDPHLRYFKFSPGKNNLKYHG